jgi:hypothetical protein
MHANGHGAIMMALVLIFNKKPLNHTIDETSDPKAQNHSTRAAGKTKKFASRGVHAHQRLEN